MGEFVIISYYLPGTLRSEQRNMYFMDEYVYHNRYFMNYIVNAYPSRNYSLKINHYNIAGQIDDDYFTSFYYPSDATNHEWVNTIFVVAAVLLLIVSLIFIFVGKPKKGNVVLSSILHLGILFVPYIFFSILYKVTDNVSFMSEAASKTNMFIILIYSFVYIMILLFGKQFFEKRIRVREKGVYDVDL